MSNQQEKQQIFLNNLNLRSFISFYSCLNFFFVKTFLILILTSFLIVLRQMKARIHIHTQEKSESEKEKPKKWNNSTNGIEIEDMKNGMGSEKSFLVN